MVIEKPRNWTTKCYVRQIVPYSVFQSFKSKTHLYCTSSPNNSLQNRNNHINVRNQSRSIIQEKEHCIPVNFLTGYKMSKSKHNQSQFGKYINNAPTTNIERKGTFNNVSISNNSKKLNSVQMLTQNNKKASKNLLNPNESLFLYRLQKLYDTPCQSIQRIPQKSYIYVSNQKKKIGIPIQNIYCPYCTQFHKQMPKTFSPTQFVRKKTFRKKIHIPISKSFKEMSSQTSNESCHCFSDQPNEQFYPEYIDPSYSSKFLSPKNTKVIYQARPKICCCSPPCSSSCNSSKLFDSRKFRYPSNDYSISCTFKKEDWNKNIKNLFENSAVYQNKSNEQDISVTESNIEKPTSLTKPEVGVQCCFSVSREKNDSQPNFENCSLILKTSISTEYKLNNKNANTNSCNCSANDFKNYSSNPQILKNSITVNADLDTNTNNLYDNHYGYTEIAPLRHNEYIQTSFHNILKKDATTSICEILNENINTPKMQLLNNWEKQLSIHYVNSNITNQVDNLAEDTDLKFKDYRKKPFVYNNKILERLDFPSKKEKCVCKSDLDKKSSEIKSTTIFIPPLTEKKSVIPNNNNSFTSQLKIEFSSKDNISANENKCEFLNFLQEYTNILASRKKQLDKQPKKIIETVTPDEIVKKISSIISNKIPSRDKKISSINLITEIQKLFETLKTIEKEHFKSYNKIECTLNDSYWLITKIEHLIDNLKEMQNGKESTNINLYEGNSMNNVNLNIEDIYINSKISIQNESEDEIEHVSV